MLQDILEKEFLPCECCRLKYTNATYTGAYKKYTEQEIKDEILFYADKLANAKWYERSYYRERIKHWNKKLIRLQEFKNEFEQP